MDGFFIFKPFPNRLTLPNTPATFFSNLEPLNDWTLNLFVSQAQVSRPEPHRYFFRRRTYIFSNLELFCLKQDLQD